MAAPTRGANSCNPDHGHTFAIGDHALPRLIAIHLELAKQQIAYKRRIALRLPPAQERHYPFVGQKGHARFQPVDEHLYLIINRARKRLASPSILIAPAPWTETSWTKASSLLKDGEQLIPEQPLFMRPTNWEQVVTTVVCCCLMVVSDVVDMIFWRKSEDYPRNHDQTN